ncbi:GlxA family transcriptional regulator [Mesorhizobium sp.]|uniref:GlxA family transcriptional regulator n=1 Tax=Mesorhizobium sp. TaxID=1871066 RepID=UPI000FE4A6C6|nr:GlxA family transcriptional regulator [Mesorhizobium sp.]RWK94396.1 MAG: GlxA family transcriptional regulator [Mesorhizobium sp.]TIQ27151.1 MAG: GlxA family transcriptional regulator [Mesorhizobium sp.]
MNAPFLNDTTNALPRHEKAGSRRLNIAIVVLPGFSHLALHSYIEPLCIANSLSEEPLFRWQLVGLDGWTVIGANGLAVPVDATIAALDARGTKGGVLDQLIIVAGEMIEKQAPDILNSFLRKMARLGVGISAIGTATWVLARAGLLADIRCTIHWSKLAAFSEVFRTARIQDSLFVKEGQYSTCAGELAAFDLALDFISTHAGEITAQDVCKHATVEGRRSGSNRQTGSSGLALARVSAKLAAAIRIMEENIESPLPLTKLAKRMELSRRQLERLFKTHISTTPAKYYLNLRVEHSRRLIEGTRLPMIDIAIASGFVSASHFAKCFKAIHGISPQNFRSNQAGVVRSRLWV